MSNKKMDYFVLEDYADILENIQDNTKRGPFINGIFLKACDTNSIYPNCGTRDELREFIGKDPVIDFSLSYLEELSDKKLEEIKTMKESNFIYNAIFEKLEKVADSLIEEDVMIRANIDTCEDFIAFINKNELNEYTLQFNYSDNFIIAIDDESDEWLILRPVDCHDPDDNTVTLNSHKCCNIISFIMDNDCYFLDIGTSDTIFKTFINHNAKTVNIVKYFYYE